MKKISKKRLLELGFKMENKTTFRCLSVFVESYPESKLMDVYVSSFNTDSVIEAQPALGVKTENDLISLCKLVNG